MLLYTLPIPYELCHTIVKTPSRTNSGMMAMREARTDTLRDAALMWQRARDACA